MVGRGGTVERGGWWRRRFYPEGRKGDGKEMAAGV